MELPTVETDHPLTAEQAEDVTTEMQPITETQADAETVETDPLAVADVSSAEIEPQPAFAPAWQSTVSIVIPMGEPSGHISMDLNDHPLTGQDSDTWRRFIAGLRETEATIDGNPIITSKDGIRWLLRQMRGG